MNELHEHINVFTFFNNYGWWIPKDNVDELPGVGLALDTTVELQDCILVLKR